MCQQISNKQDDSSSGPLHVCLCAVNVNANDDDDDDCDDNEDDHEFSLLQFCFVSCWLLSSSNSCSSFIFS